MFKELRLDSHYKEGTMRLTLNNNLNNIVKENEMKKGLLWVTLGLFFILMLSSCSDNKYPPSVYDPEEEYLADPVISTVSPATKTYQGVGIVTINGVNFSTDMSNNQVTFNGVGANIFQDESNETTLKVKVPNVIIDPAINIIDSVKIRVALTGALLFAVYPPDNTINFQLERASVEWGGFGDLDLVHAVACDASENLYVTTEDKLVFKVDSTGAKADFGTTTSTIVTGMRVGWNGDLYYARNYKYLYKIPAGGGDSEKFNTASLPDRGKAYDLDFDANGNLIIVGKGDQSIWVMKSDASAVAYDAYTDFELISCRVYNGYVYVAGVYTGDGILEVSEGVWKSTITGADSQIGARELVFDWATYVGEEGPALFSLAINADGLLFLGAEEQYDGTDYVKGDAITVYDETSATAASLYSEVLYPPSTNFCWGNSNYLYIVRNTSNPGATDAPSKRLIRVAFEFDGAPYYGRSL